MKNCKTCGVQTNNPKFCSKSCAAKFNNVGVRRHGKSPGICLNCQKFKPIRNPKFCSNKCTNEYVKKMTIENWINDGQSLVTGGRLKNGIRRFLLEKSNYSCSECGWNKINKHTGKCPLEIDHIDGNSNNNNITNLRVLCPNCHSLTNTWKALNKGKGNKERLKYSKLVE